MKKIYNTLLIFCSIFFMASCQEDMDSFSNSGTGFLCLTVNGSNETTTRAATLPEGYTGRQIAVEIVNAKDSVVQKTDDWENWKDHLIELPVGQYTIKAHSYGFDGQQSALAAPYYYGSKTITIEKDKELREKVTCKLANVKMSVKMSDELKKAFKSFNIHVTSKEEGKCDPIFFYIDLSASAIKDTAYFPATDLVVTYSATNQDDVKNSATKELTKVKGNDHYILNFTLGKAENGNGDVTVEVDETLHTYVYTFTVSQTPTNGAQLSANAWAKFAYLTAENVTATSGIDLSKLKFQYRPKEAKDWIDLETKLNDEVYSATAVNLMSNTTYLYRLVNDTDFKSDSLEFSTEEVVALYNGNFDDWSQSGKTIYANASGDPVFWDSSNPGTTTGAGAMVGINPTQGVTSPVYDAGNTSEGKTDKAAELKSQTASLFGVPVKLAAASLYTGQFQTLSGTNGAKIKFGQPFVSRPTSLHGWYQYAPGKVDWGGDKLAEGADDICSIYFALVTEQYVVNNDPEADDFFLMDFNTDPRVLAFGELPADMCISTGGAWKEFNIDLKYNSLEKPQNLYLVIVVSASKYGDYFTGSSSSVMYIDDFELVYGDEPTVQE